jgi:hypothetical protein
MDILRDICWRLETIVSTMANNPRVNLIELIERGELDDVLDTGFPSRTRKKDLEWLIYLTEEACDYLKWWGKVLERALLKMD